MSLAINKIPLSLYIHMPWCVQKCPYCDFNSHALRNDLPESAYIDALIAEIQQQLPQINQRPIHSIFIGGGTPSLFSPTAYEKLWRAMEQLLIFEKDLEITLEANPGTAEQNRFSGYFQMGINRLSLGMQSFQDEKLKLLGRIHNSDEAKRAMEMAQYAGFNNINMDLMHGLPQQSVNDALFDLQTAIALRPTHLSWYQLTLEPNTYFYKHPPALPADDILGDIQTQGETLLKQAGFEQYEISAYSQASYQCRHNLNYWEFGDYWGIGAGAHSKITDKNGFVHRYENAKSPIQYMNSESRIAQQKTVTKDELQFEFMLNALRLKKPVSFELLTQRTGLSREYIKNSLSQAQKKHLITISSNAFSTTPQGWRFLNEVLELFLP